MTPRLGRAGPDKRSRSGWRWAVGAEIAQRLQRGPSALKAADGVGVARIGGAPSLEGGGVGG